MSSHSSEGEVLSPSGIPAAPVDPPQYAPGEDVQNARRRREHSGWSPMLSPATYGLVGINIAVYLWMVLHGVSLTLPTPQDLVHYGANDTSLVLGQGEWYRLFTAIFLHVGIVHLASNMWCLWNLGLLGEPLVGPFGLLAVYVITGLAGNLLSVAWDVAIALYTRGTVFTEVGAGASGAVFGIAGILIILLSNHKLPIPWPELKRLRRSVIQFAFLNLIIGGATILPVFGSIVRIDNSAHLGGFMSGLALGVPLMPRMTAGRDKYLERQKAVFPIAALLLALFSYWIYKLSR